VSAYSVDGSKESILVKDVFAVEKREPRVGVTIGLVVLAVLAVVGVVEAETLGHAGH
jgi:Mg/Co/Ni transporter MgtE